jgi:hypothetical protein
MINVKEYDQVEIWDDFGGADTIAACYLENSLNQGKTVSIPSLGITIKEPSGNAITCKNTRK